MSVESVRSPSGHARTMFPPGPVPAPVPRNVLRPSLEGKYSLSSSCPIPYCFPPLKNSLDNSLKVHRQRDVSVVHGVYLLVPCSISEQQCATSTRNRPAKGHNLPSKASGPMQGSKQSSRLLGASKNKDTERFTVRKGSWWDLWRVGDCAGKRICLVDEDWIVNFY